MTTTIREINPTWKSYLPADVINVTYASAGLEKQIRWGVALAGGKSGFGFAGSSPPAQQQNLGTQFDLGTLRYFNQLIGGQAAEEVTLELELVYQDLSTISFAVTLSIETVGENDIVTAKDGFPIEVDVDGTQLTVLGFNGVSGVEEQLVAPEGGTVTAGLTAILLSTPKEEDHCIPGEFEPVFDPERCTVPPVCPISPEPIIDDCGIPEEPPPMTDCPEIDIPTFASIPTTAGDGVPGPPGPPGDPGCIPFITVSYQTVYVQDCNLQRVSVIAVPLLPCDLHIHFIFYLCRPYYLYYECCIYVCCNGVWELLDGGSNCQLQSGTTTTPYPGYSGTQIVPAPASSCTEDGLVVIKCPCERTTVPAEYCVEPACGQFSDCRLMTNIMQVAISPNECLCAYESEAIYDGSSWVAESTNCNGDFVKLNCYSPGSGGWEIVLQCNGNTYVNDNLTIRDNGDGTCTFTATFGQNIANELAGCCPAGDVLAISFTGNKCSETTSTTQAPDCVEVGCIKGDCRFVPGSVDLTVTGSTCNWPTELTYSSKTGCWVGDCDNGTISMCCAGGVLRITLEESGVTDTATPVTSFGTVCAASATFSSPPFAVETGVTVSWSPCDTGTVEEDCVSSGCDPTDQFEREGTVSITGGGCCGYNRIVSVAAGTDPTSSACWVSRGTSCPDNDAVVELCCDPPWRLRMSCGGSVQEEFPLIFDDGVTTEFEATFDSSTFGSGCCSGTGSDDITVVVTLTKCCTEDRKECHWVWIWDDIEMTFGHWEEIVTVPLCEGCVCVQQPAYDGTFSGQTAKTDATCS